jgi:hypothetical protein
MQFQGPPGVMAVHGHTSVGQANETDRQAITRFVIQACRRHLQLQYCHLQGWCIKLAAPVRLGGP